MLVYPYCSWGSGTRTTRPVLGRSPRRWRCAELLGVDLATIGQAATHVQPYVRIDGTKVWSLMQLERQLHPPGLWPGPGRLHHPSPDPGDHHLNRTRSSRWRAVLVLRLQPADHSPRWESGLGRGGGVRRVPGGGDPGSDAVDRGHGGEGQRADQVGVAWACRYRKPGPWR
jgi:hypothetical protein